MNLESKQNAEVKIIFKNDTEKKNILKEFINQHEVTEERISELEGTAI